jgi:GNAT superfamily N-acetyltransferase
MIRYQTGNNLDLDQVIGLYRASSLGVRRPIDDRERFGAMLQNANLVITAWDSDLLVGISRCLTDFNFFTYLADLVVRDTYQRNGIGKELMRLTQKCSGPKTSILLLAAPDAEKYYPHVGFEHAPQAWLLKPGESIR